MGDAGILAGAVIVALAGLAAIGTLLAGATWPAPRRAGLVAGGLPLALLAPALATAYGSWDFVRAFSDVMGAPAAARGLPAVFASFWLLQRAAWGACAVACLVGLLLALSRVLASSGDEAPPCSASRALVLIALPVLGVLVAGLATRPFVTALRVSSALVLSDPRDPAKQKRAEAVLEDEGLAATGSGSLARTSRFLARSLVLGVLGGVLGSLVLLGLAVPGLVLASRVRFGPAFAGAASALWIAVAAGASLVALGVVDPLLRP